MGLDAVELLMEVEDRFHISICDEDATMIHSVGELADMVTAHLAKTDASRSRTGCVSRRVFYRVRSALMDTAGAQRRSVRPHSRLEEFFPVQQRVVGWGQLAAATQYHLPKLARPQWMTDVLLLIPIGCIVTSLIVNWRALPIATIGGFVLMFLGYALTRPLEVQVPESAQTVGELVRTICATNYLALDPPAASEETFEIVRKIVSEQFGVNEEEIERKTRFLEDLNVG